MATTDLKICSLADLARIAETVSRVPYLIDGLLRQQSITMTFGDTGLGKSPFQYQAALCVASGRDFLGRAVKKTRVLYMDCENSQSHVYALVTQLMSFLEIKEEDADIAYWNLNDCDADPDFEQIVTESGAGLVIVDPVSAIWPRFETDAPTATETYKSMRALMQKTGTTINGIHHLRKQGEHDVTPLEHDDLLRWFQRVRGSRVAVTGCDVRLGIDNSQSVSNGLVLRGYERVAGEVPPIQVERVYDGDGSPIGFRSVSAVRLLNNPEQERTYGALPRQFAFKQAMQAYGRADEATNHFLKKCLSLGLLRKPERGVYVKTVEAARTMEVSATGANHGRMGGVSGVLALQ
jgi:hypothetical protein